MTEVPGPAAQAVSNASDVFHKPWLWLGAGALVYLSFGFTEMMGSDLWWHLAAGREIVQTGTIWLVDDWSYTEYGSPWRNHEWLADLIFFAWAKLLGVPSLVYWKWLLIVSSFTVLQNALTRLSGCPAAALLACILGVVLAAPFLDMRPQLYSLLGVAILFKLSLLRRARLRELLPLFLVWVNLHGGFIFGLMLLAILEFPWRSLSLVTVRSAVLRVLACAAVCLLNPDGLRVFWLPLVYALDSASPYRSLAEWRSPFVDGGIRSSLYVYSLMIAAASSLLWVLPAVRRAVIFLPEAVALGLLTAAMSSTSRRFIILWAFAVALLMTPFIAALLRQRLLQLALPLVLLATFATAAIRLAPYSWRSEVAYHYLTAEYAYPHAVADFIELNDLQGKTFAYYNWGGFLHWRGDGALKVYLDGRANTLFDDQTYLDYVSVLAAQPGWLQRIENSGAEFFLWPRTRGGQRLIRGLLDTRRWRLLYQDARGVLLARKSLDLPARLKIPRGTAMTELALAYSAFKRADYPLASRAVEQAYAQRPWDYEVCVWRKRTLQALGRSEEAEASLQACADWFPSKYLR
ncbi:MAG: hypothetical protein AB8B57_10175 [Congregibacter sp.]